MKMILPTIVFCLCLLGCEERKQYYTRHFHNESGEKLRNVVLQWDDGTTSRSVGGTLAIGAVKISDFNYIPPPINPGLRWEDLKGNKYEYLLDLEGIFPTRYNGGHLHITIENDFSVDYAFAFLPFYKDGKLIRDRVVYSTENRTAK